MNTNPVYDRFDLLHKMFFQKQENSTKDFGFESLMKFEKWVSIYNLMVLCHQNIFSWWYNLMVLTISDLMVWTRWFNVTFSSPSWRSLNHLKGSLNHPKKGHFESPGIVTFIQSPSKTELQRSFLRQTCCFGNSNVESMSKWWSMLVGFCGKYRAYNIWKNTSFLFGWSFFQLLLGMKQFFFFIKPPGLTLLWRVQRCGNANPLLSSFFCCLQHTTSNWGWMSGNMECYVW